jgi:hypothetical protein
MGNNYITPFSAELRDVLNKDICYYTDDSKLVVINIQLKKEVLNANPLGKSSKVKLIMSNNNYAIVHPNQNNTYRDDAIIVAEYDWYPQTKMRDYLLLDPYTPNEIIIPKESGIGIIIVEALNTYIRLSYNENKDNGLEVIYSV